MSESAGESARRAAGEPTGSPDAALRVRYVLGMLALGGVGLLAMVAWAGLLAGLLAGVGVPLAGGTAQVVSGVGTLLGAASAAGAYLSWSGRGPAFLDLGRPGLRDLAYVAGGVVAILVAAEGVGALLAGAGIETATHGLEERAREDPAILLPAIPAALLFVGPGEELLYRNVVQKVLYEAFPRWRAVGLASGVFAAVHLPVYAVGAETPASLAVTLLVVLVLSLILGVVYDRTRNLWAAALVHGGYDAVLFAVLYLQLS